MTETAALSNVPVALLCRELVELQKQRRFCLKMQARLDRGLDAALAMQLGYHGKTTPEPLRREIFARVKAIRAAVRTDDQLAELSPTDQALAENWQLEITLTEQSRSGWDKRRADIEQRIAEVAQQLPVWAWCEPIRGITPLGLGVIVGEACGPNAPELGSYKSHQSLCKRLSIGVIGGHRQGSPGKGADADDWTREGYKPERRSQIWQFLDYALRNAQYRNEGGPLGLYGAIYQRQAAIYEERGWKHAKRAAGRYMAKCFLRDLYRAWHSEARYSQ